MFSTRQGRRGQSFSQDAVRESIEEIGIDGKRVKFMGRLDDVWSQALYLPVPVIA